MLAAGKGSLALDLNIDMAFSEKRSNGTCGGGDVPFQSVFQHLWHVSMHTWLFFQFRNMFIMLKKKEQYSHELQS